MNLILTRPLIVGHRVHLPGDVVTLDDERSAELLRSGAARPAPPVVETASRADPPRRAARRTGRAG